jgi:pantoate--beta-alanine ligase
MQVVSDKKVLQEQLADWRHAGDRIALVPTMGNLHRGHGSLVDVARRHADRVVVSIFVNPTQFGEGEDFNDYPRTLEPDVELLAGIGADLLFAPEVDTVYPFGLEQATTISVPFLNDQLCGSSRPGHFDGVTTVVARLFALTRPDIAVFGKKDYQQQLIIRRMVADLNVPIDIITAPTVREDDGLAMSSRNAYLSHAQRAVAPALHATLLAIVKDLQQGDRNFLDLERRAIVSLSESGFQPDYVAVRCALDLGNPGRACEEIVVLGAAYLGTARLIDNITIAL